MVVDALTCRPDDPVVVDDAVHALEKDASGTIVPLHSNLSWQNGWLSGHQTLSAHLIPAAAKLVQQCTLLTTHEVPPRAISNPSRAWRRYSPRHCWKQ